MKYQVSAADYAACVTDGACAPAEPRNIGTEDAIAFIAFAFYRRLVLHPKRLEGDKLEHTDALIILSLIGLLMLTLLLMNAFALVATPGISIGYWKARKTPFTARSSGSISRMLSPFHRTSPLVTS